jgi:hypothetical protein
MRQFLFWQSVIDTLKEIVPSRRDVYQEALSVGALFPTKPSLTMSLPHGHFADVNFSPNVRFAAGSTDRRNTLIF